MNRRDFDIDHIDPRWKDGRDYQLVCGLDCPLNFRESDPSFNTSKSNRFLPWRWSLDEIGVVPTEPGDLAFFLVNEEWVLMEFLSPEWFEASWETCSLFVNNRLSEWQANNREEFIESCRRGGSIGGPKGYSALEAYYAVNPHKHLEHGLLGAAVTKQLFAENPDEPKRRSELARGPRKKWAKENPEEQQKICSAAGVASGKVRVQCTITGFISTGAGLSSYQKARGIDHKDPNNRIRIN